MGAQKVRWHFVPDPQQLGRVSWQCLHGPHPAFTVQAQKGPKVCLAFLKGQFLVYGFVILRPRPYREFLSAIRRLPAAEDERLESQGLDLMQYELAKLLLPIVLIQAVTMLTKNRWQSVGIY